ncbi:hypothetical protein NQ318_023205 [Aromia moschata]|uniref:DUF4817 domain-containing protein n=1 Tax=Aromia moschata TaxID=1265417 RepID=A0AAV8X7Q4_9CUCU|nr:hypothetical protein NQ318_023205 [Aromia moschata]
MSYLTESLKIEILTMIGYGERARTQCEVVRLFRETSEFVRLFRETHPELPPLNQGTISKIESQYREMGHVRKVLSKRQAVVDDDTKLNLLLALEENIITPARQLARDSNLNHKTVLKILKYEKKRPYKMQAVQELLEQLADPDRRLSNLTYLHVCKLSNEAGNVAPDLGTPRKRDFPDFRKGGRRGAGPVADGFPSVPVKASGAVLLAQFPNDAPVLLGSGRYWPGSQLFEGASTSGITTAGGGTMVVPSGGGAATVVDLKTIHTKHFTPQERY